MVVPTLLAVLYSRFTFRLAEEVGQLSLYALGLGSMFDMLSHLYVFTHLRPRALCECQHIPCQTVAFMYANVPSILYMART